MKTLTLIFLFITMIAHAQNFEKTFSTQGDFGSNSDEAIFVQQNSNGDYIIVGSPDVSDVVVIKLSPSGDTIYQKFISANFKVVGASQTTDGGVIVCGRDYNFNSKMVVIKVDDNGNEEWAKSYCGQTGNADDGAESIQQTSDGGYILTGYSIGIGQGVEDIQVIKLNESGSVSWAKVYSGFIKDKGEYIIETTDGGYLIAGYSNSFGNVHNDVYVVKITSQGNYSWSKTYGTVNEDFTHFVLQSADGGYILSCGYYLMKTNSSGVLEWSKQFNGVQIYTLGNVIELSNGNLILTGTVSDLAQTNIDAFLSELDEDGNIQWFKTYGGSETDYGNYVATIPSGYIVCGRTSSFNSSSFDMFVFTVGLDGSTVCGGETQAATTSNISIDSDNPTDYIATGGPIGSFTASNGAKEFTTKTICSNVGITDVPHSSGIEIFPIPASNFITIKSEYPFTNSEIIITDILGNVCKRSVFQNEKSQTLSIEELPQGIYLMQIGNQILRKFIKE